MSIVFTGVALASVNFRAFYKSDMFSIQSGVPYALLCAVVWGIAFPLYKFPSDHLGALFYGLVLEIAVLAFTSLQLFVMPKFEAVHAFKKVGLKLSFHSVVFTVVAAISIALGTVFLNLAYQSGEVSIVAAICGSSSVVSLFVGWIVYRERLSFLQYSGAVLVTLGILLPVFSVL